MRLKGRWPQNCSKIPFIDGEVFIAARCGRLYRMSLVLGNFRNDMDVSIPNVFDPNGVAPKLNMLGLKAWPSLKCD